MLPSAQTVLGTGRTHSPRSSSAATKLPWTTVTSNVRRCRTPEVPNACPHARGSKRDSCSATAAAGVGLHDEPRSPFRGGLQGQVPIQRVAVRSAVEESSSRGVVTRARGAALRPAAPTSDHPGARGGGQRPPRAMAARTSPPGGLPVAYTFYFQLELELNGHRSSEVCG